jgi:hypothetical protein
MTNIVEVSMLNNTVEVSTLANTVEVAAATAAGVEVAATAATTIDLSGIPGGPTVIAVPYADPWPVTDPLPDVLYLRLAL